jgi:hypothetical protein
MPSPRNQSPPAQTPKGPNSELIHFLAHTGLIGPWIGLLNLLLKVFGPIALIGDQAADLTAGGRFWVRQERDVALYIGFVTIVVGVLFLSALSRRFLNSSRGHSLWLPATGLIIAFVPSLFWSALTQSTNAHLWCLLFAITAATHTGASLLKSGQRDPSFPADIARTFPASDNAHKKPNKISLLVDILAPVFLIWLIYIPDTARLAGRFFIIEEFFHLNGFLMTGAIAFKHGLALYKDLIPVYGAGWPVLFGSFSKGDTLSYGSILQVSMWVSVIYFTAFYLLCRRILRCRILAFSLCLFAVVAQTFPGFEPENKSIIWRWGGGYPMRAPTEIAFFLCLWRYIETRSSMAALLCGLSAAMTLFFAIDLGVYVTAALLAFWCYVLFFTRHKESLRQAGYSLGAFILTATCAFLWATRGSLFSPATFANVFNYIARTCGGFGLVPFAELQWGWVLAFSLIATILLAQVSGSLLRPASERSLLQAFAFAISLYALERMVQFMGRTMWSYLLASAVPFLIAAATALRVGGVCPLNAGPANGSPGLLQRKTLWIALFPTLGAILWFALSKDLPNYPALWNAKARAELSANPLQLLPDSSDVKGLPAPYQPYLATIAQLIERLHALKTEGNRIQILDACSTTFYVLADLPPYGRDSNEMDRADISKKEIARLLQDIAERGPEIIVLNKVPFPWPRSLCQEAWQAARDSLFSYYRKKEEIGPFEIWRRHKPAAGKETGQ